MKPFIDYTARLGEVGIGQFRTMRSMMELLYDTVVGLLQIRRKRHVSTKQLLDQVLFTGVDAFAIISFIGLLCGVTISIQAMTNMPKIGVGEFFGKIMVIAVVRELGPFFTSIVVIGRSGAALAAYIGNMRITKEISALRAMGINLTHFLVLPAFVGMIVSLICLNIYFDLVAIVGGLLFAQMTVSETFVSLLWKVLEALSMQDVGALLLKNVLFGGTIAVISCYHGLSVDNIRIVPRAVFRAVVGSIVVTMLINVTLTVLFYAGKVTG